MLLCFHIDIHFQSHAILVLQEIKLAARRIRGERV